MVRKIKGKGSSDTVKHFTRNDTIFTSEKDISNKIAEAISKNSSSISRLYLRTSETYNK